MKSFAFAALASAAAAISEDELSFMNYAARFNKIYEDVEEFAVRLERFIHWHRIISEHNSTDGANGLFHKNFKLGHNQFSDWTDDEYVAILGYGEHETDESDKSRVMDFDEVSEKFEVFISWPWSLPDINWVKKGFNASVKDQGHCGSCWAFSAIGALEGAYFAKYGELLSFSAQQLIDCDTQSHDVFWHDKGCKGGNMVDAFKYLEDKFAMLESVYPYTSYPKDAPSTDC